MKIANFHLNLLGKDRAQTPERFWLTDRHRDLYTGFETGVRGFDCELEDEELFLGTAVLALSQTEGGTRQVVLVLPPHLMDWALGQIKAIARRVFSTRKGDIQAVRTLRNAFQQLQLTSQESFQEVPEPRMWVTFGYGRETPLSAPLPAWMVGRTLDETVYLSDFS